MCNLEELTLLMVIIRLNCDDFADGNHLENDFMMHLSRLQKFRFSIRTSLFLSGTFVDEPSNAYVQESFRRSIFGPVGSYVEHYPAGGRSTCRV